MNPAIFDGSCYPETIRMALLNNSAFSQVTALAELRPVHTAFAWLHGNPKTIMDWQAELVSIPAPPFGEQARSLWMAVRTGETSPSIAGAITSRKPESTPQRNCGRNTGDTFSNPSDYGNCCLVSPGRSIEGGKNPPPFGSIVFHSNPQKYPPWWSRSASASTDAVGGRHDLDKSHPQSIRCQSRRSKAPG